MTTTRRSWFATLAAVIGTKPKAYIKAINYKTRTVTLNTRVAALYEAQESRRAMLEARLAGGQIAPIGEREFRIPFRIQKPIGSQGFIYNLQEPGAESHVTAPRVLPGPEDRDRRCSPEITVPPREQAVTASERTMDRPGRTA